MLLLGSRRGYNLEQFVTMALEQIGCTVAFVGHEDFLRPVATPLRMIISRSRTARRLAIPFGLRKYNEMVKVIGNDFSPDLVLSIKGEAVLPSTIEWFRSNVGSTTALWYPDDPRYFHSLSTVIAPHYDFVFTAARKFVETYRDIGVPHSAHLPFGCEPIVHRPFVLSQDEARIFACDVCFVGTYSQKRDRIVRALAKEGFNVGVWGPFWRFFRLSKNIHGPVVGPELARVFSGAKIVLNIHDDSDVGVKANMRTFEATGCGSLLVTDNSQEIEEYFEPQREVVCYDSVLQLTSLLRQYVSSSGDRALLSAQAHNRAYGQHTYRQRLQTLLRVVG